jgi:hypothetical protein
MTMKSFVKKDSVVKLGTCALLLCSMVAGTARAETADRVLSVDVPTDVMYQQIVSAATDMCRDAVASGETVNQRRCTAVVVAKTIAEANLPSLTLYAQGMPLSQRA